MPGRLVEGDVPRKRKRDEMRVQKSVNKPRKAPRASGDDGEAAILQYETALLDPANADLASLRELLRLAKTHEQRPQVAMLAGVSLCRVLCSFVASEKLSISPSDSVAVKDSVRLLKGHYRECVNCLSDWIGSANSTVQTTAVTLLMRLVKEEITSSAAKAEQAWRTTSAPFNSLVDALLSDTDAGTGRQHFVETYVEEYDDVRYFTLSAIQKFMKEGDRLTDNFIDNVIDLLTQIEGVPESQDQLEDWLGIQPSSSKHALLSLSAHRRAGQDAWLAVFRSSLTPEQRKRLLEVMTSSIIPWFSTKLESLTDFLVDSFNASSSIAVIALDGLFQLITTRNLDYPEFYTKLYSLLDDSILHSKHRNRFFRLLDSCLASSHLPAAMIASFIKRLARLSLQAPPGAIVWLIPFTYNMLRQHPSCTFMIHRSPHPSHRIYAANEDYTELGMDDPFDMTQPDPMLSRAIDSSLWELDTLRTHCHPNVATLAGILAEQFTKREYQMEDFLDHTYASLLDAELGKDLKKTPVVEFDIPKHIITSEAGDGTLNSLGQLLQTAIASA